MPRFEPRGVRNWVRAAALALALATAACTATVPPTPTAPLPDGPTPSSARDGATSGSEFVIWTRSLYFGPFLFGDHLVQRLVKSGLFRLDDRLAAQPDLAADACAVAPDFVTIDCSLRDATFHDGTPVTADDVVFSMELQRSRCGDDFCLGVFPSDLESIEALNERTVRFVLFEPNPAFLAAELPWGAWQIESRVAVESTFVAFSERAAHLDRGPLDEALGSIHELDEVGCDSEAQADRATAIQLADRVDSLLDGVVETDRSGLGEGDEFDVCHYLVQEVEWILAGLSQMKATTGIDAIAAAYNVFIGDALPIGSGPYRVVSLDPGVAILEAFEGYHFGRPATSRVIVREFENEADAAEQMKHGPGTILEFGSEAGSARQLREFARLQVVESSTWDYLALAFNLRPGRLFTEVELRRALARCIDRPAIVDAATAGAGSPFDSPVPPTSWAYQPSIQPVARDVAEGRALVESAGWSVGPDGIYEKDGRRLAADIAVRADSEERRRFVELVALQAGDCGMQLKPLLLSQDQFRSVLVSYPHDLPGTGTPFEALFIGWSVGPDPDSDQWHSTAVTSEENPADENFIGLDDPIVDGLLEQGRATYDRTSRARIYKDLQERIVELQPYIFAWSPTRYSAIDADLRSTAGQLDFESPQWWWQLESLTVDDDS